MHGPLPTSSHPPCNGPTLPPPLLFLPGPGVQDACIVPVRLSCGHQFCEGCIGEWFERDREGTCPVCRACVKPPDLQLFLDGATSLLPMLF